MDPRVDRFSYNEICSLLPVLFLFHTSLSLSICLSPSAFETVINIFFLSCLFAVDRCGINCYISHANGEGNVYLREGGQAGEGGRVQHFLYRYMALSRSDSILLHYVFFLFLFLKLYFASSKKINLDSFGSRKQ